MKKMCLCLLFLWGFGACSNSTAGDQCTTGNRRCDGNVLQECENSSWTTVQECAYRCVPSGSTNAMCFNDPTNEYPWSGNPNEDVPYNDTDIDTDTDTEGDIHVYLGGYVMAGPWMGYPWTQTDGVTATTISPEDFSAAGAGDSLCVVGSVAADENATGLAMLGVNVNQTDDNGGSGPAETISIENGVMVRVASTISSPLWLQIAEPNSDTVPGTRWCAVISDGKNSVPLADFSSSCLDTDGVPYDESPIASIIVAVPGNDTNDTSFDFCLTGLGPM